MLDRGGEREIRVFISSPGDVGEERARAADVLKELSAEFAERFRLVPVLWEQSYYSAHQTFQEAIPKPSSCDLVVCILWKRLGTELPPAFNRADATTRTGTEYEFEEALEAALLQDVPDILVYRKRVLVDADRLGQEAAELRALNAFWQRWFSDERGNFTASFQRFDSSPEFYDKLKRDLRQWLGRLSPEVTWPIDTLGSPFRSLEPFDASHARVFFGRRRAVRQAIAKLVSAAARGCAFLLVLGGSGTGKSSLARAGILPALISERAAPEIGAWRAGVFTPATFGDDLQAGFAAALRAPETLPELGQSTAVAIADAVAAIGNPGEDARLLLVIDQLEELLFRPSADRDGLIDLLDALARSGKVWIVATLRNDRYAEFQTVPGLVRLKEDGDSLDLLPPGPAEIREIVEGPAAAAGLRFEEDGERALARVLENAGHEPGALPLLQFTLESLFRERDIETGTLLLSVYDRLGGLAGAIAGEAERLIERLPASSVQLLPGFLLKLVDIDQETETASARTVRRSDLINDTERDLADRMIAGRLLSVDGAGSEIRLRLVHEALLLRWPRLAELVTEHRAFLGIRHRLDTDAAIWLAHDRHADFLLPSGRRLAEAAEVRTGRSAELDEATAQFIDASVARQLAEEAAQRIELAQRAEAAEARARALRALYRRTLAAVGIVSVLLLVMVGLSVLWLSERQVARQHEAEAEANYTTALTAATSYLDILDGAAATGRITFQVKQAILKVTQDAFGNLPSENEKPEAAIARVRLMIALETEGNAAADNGDKAVDLARALVQQDPTNIDRQELLQEALWQLGSRSVILGNLAKASDLFTEAERIAEKVVAARPDDATWTGRLNTNKGSVASVMFRRGDLAGALDRFRAINELIGQGDVLLAEGDAAGAADVFRQALANAIEHEKRIGIHANGNSDTVLERTHEKFADALRVKGDNDAALKHYKDAVAFGEGLFQNKLGSFAAERILFAATRGSADIAYAKGDIADATTQYQAMLAAATTRIQAAADFTAWQAQLGEVDERLGDMALMNKDIATAEKQYRSEVALAEKVAAAVKDDTEGRRDLELAHGRLGAALRAKGDGEGALAEFRTQVRMADDLVKLSALDADWQRDLALSLAALGGVLAERQDHAAAADAFRQCAAIPIKTVIDPRDELAHDPRDACRAGQP